MFFLQQRKHYSKTLSNQKYQYLRCKFQQQNYLFINNWIYIIIQYSMKTKHLLVFALLISAFWAQNTISLQEVLKNSKAANPTRVEETKPVQDKPVENKTVQERVSIAQVAQDDEVVDENFDPSDDPNFVPCEKKDSCGEAKSFSSGQQFEDFVKKYNTENSAPQFNMKIINNLAVNSGVMGGLSGAAIADMAMAAKPAALPSVDPGRDFSGTNNQVQGVDEADLLKTDGTYIYTISNKILSIVLAYPQTKAKVVSKINMKDLNPSAIFIEGDYLAVFGTEYNYYSYPCPYYYPYPYPIYNKGPVFLDTVAATAGPAARLLQEERPAVKDDLTISNLRVVPLPGIIRPPPIVPPISNCRASNPYTWIKIYDVSNRGNPFLVKEFKAEGSYLNGRKIQSGFVYLVATHQFNYRPKPYPWFDWGFGVRDLPFRSIFWYPGTYTRPSAVNIISFDLKNPLSGTKNIVTICAESANIMYMSHKHIYLTTSSWEGGSDYTKIRKIFVSGKYIKPIADGKVRGSVNNQFSLDQYKQFFRIATTSNNAGTTSNNVFCLGYYLNVVGSLTGVAPGQRIFSARYVGTKLYLVTFRQIDPFFVISLKNHKKPKILGQLKIPGFSRYLHPYDEDYIIGFGRQADENGRQQGLKVSMFNVTDVKNPTESAQLEMLQKYASSTAEWEHKAFLLSPEKKLMVVPANMNFDGTKFNGALAIHASPKRLKLLAIVDHILKPNDNFYERNVERSLYIEDLLYTKSKCLLRINSITEKFQSLKNINIPCDQAQFNPIPVKPNIPVLPIKKPKFDPIIKIDDPIRSDPV